MAFHASLDMHFWLTRGMARRLGVNLTEALQQGVITRGDYADLLARCRACADTQACIEFLAEHPDRAAAPPEGCLEADVLNELRKLGEGEA
jgi:hypothetical protein